jgi:uncharacterized membrane protein YhaH (DUF805 family)
MNWYFKVLSKYAAFGGRARRTEYWMFTLINCVVCFALAIVATVALSASPKVALIINAVLLIYCLLVLLPSIAVTIRRLHDTGRSGGWFWIVLVPFIGGLVLLVFTVMDSTPGGNVYGPSPKTA